MDRLVLKLAVIASVLTLVLCCAAAATVPPSWLTDLETNGYVWNTWGGNLFATDFTVSPDIVRGTGTGTASVLTGDYGSGVLTGSDFAVGSVETYVELGQAGRIHVDVTPDARGMDLWIEVLFHEDVTAAPTISVAGATQLDGLQIMAEDTSLDPAMPSQWTRYQFLWRVAPEQVAQFQGIDIVADPATGSNVASVSVETHWVPEPGCLVTLAAGLAALVGVARRRRA